jgi:two-component system, cell cycle sensor histidine kinase and response regulator CckA
MELEKQVNILLVDDHPENLLALEAILKDLGHNLIKAHSGQEALRSLLSQDFAVILLDVNMPVMDGFDTAEMIRGRERSQNTPIIFLTANTRNDTHMFKGYSLGAVDFILKPVVPEILRSKVSVFVELFKKTREIERLRQLERREYEKERAQTLEALRKSEEQYRLLFESNPQPMWVYDIETLSFLAVNNAAISHYGYSRKEFLALTIKDIRPSEEIPALFQRLSEIKDGLIAGITVKHRKKDGSVIDVEVISHSIIFEGKPARFVLANDITEKKRLEAQFLRAQRMESIGTLAGGIAHDLNNILTPILMSVQFLRMRLPDERSRHIIDTLEESTQRGADLVKQVLSFARGLDGRQANLQVRHIILEIEKVIREAFPRNIDIRTDIPKDLWILSADPTQLHQILMNLCVNARDAMPDGGVLNISAKNLFIDENYARMDVGAKVGPYVVITVSDTGLGIPRNVMDKIFEPFFTTKEPGKGTGLGLSTVISLVKSHHGFVNLYSEERKGTQFKVYLPSTEIVEASQTGKDEYTELPAGHSEMILVVDDEASIREITKASLEANNYRVLTASDGIEALALYAQYKDEIEAVLTDMMMPFMGGAMTVRSLQRIDPSVKVIAVSGILSSDKISELAGLGVTTLLLKPYTADELLKTLSDLLNS